MGIQEWQRVYRQDLSSKKISRIPTSPEIISCDTNPILLYFFDMVHCNEYVTTCYIIIIMIMMCDNNYRAGVIANTIFYFDFCL